MYSILLNSDRKVKTILFSSANVISKPPCNISENVFSVAGEGWESMYPTDQGVDFSGLVKENQSQ